jgi:predicted membrane protein
MTNSEMTDDKRGTKEKLAIASLVLAITALFGVYPLALIGSNIYCRIVFGDCAFDYVSKFFFNFSCFPSAAASVVAIILGIISVRGAYTNSRIRLFGVSGIIFGSAYWPLAFVTIIILMFLGAWYTL